MGKSRTDGNGRTREQRLYYENQQLKKKISSLRKTIARLDLDRFDTVKELIEEHYKQDKKEEGKAIIENLKKTWACRHCDDGFLQIFVYNRGNETHYYRICSNAPSCLNRTKSQPYKSTVKGLFRNPEDVE